MFVDKWEPGVVPSKPELTSAPIWLELRKVPLQFFNEDGLEHIAGLVGHPKYLHPSTANKTNLEVAKVFTIIDPRKPLPEAVNVQFDSGEISRVLVSSPWMPPVCEVCKEIGHVSKRCPAAIKTCAKCNSPGHSSASCPQNQKQDPAKKKTRRGKSRDKQVWQPVNQTVNQPELQPETHVTVEPSAQKEEPVGTHSTHTVMAKDSSLGQGLNTDKGESSGTAPYLQVERPRSVSGNSKSSHSDIQPNSSDVETSDSEMEEGELSDHDEGFEVILNKKRFSNKMFSGQKGNRGRGPKLN
ncbi:uncharacterized protein LOC108830588 [Raphanus sativus]|uniref:Uncharacterized protein LOC108830588 n=1 Tax=Raphanus sativus TaxID=3726 RepID=A0A6J0LJZ0_RAPSA|nr:uncharacterized protein LOC108830588 [Raphanus sativus]